eukprot:10128816-Ditylum_brightwellii.AAC.1
MDIQDQQCDAKVISGSHLLCVPASASAFFLLGHLGGKVCSVEAVGTGAPHQFGVTIVGAPAIGSAVCMKGLLPLF